MAAYASRQLQSRATPHIAVGLRGLDDHRLGALGLMAGGVAHDMCNILQIISGNLELLAAELGPECTARLRLQSAQNGVLLGANLTKRLLEYCRSEPSELDIVDFADERITAPIAAMITDAVGELVSLHLDVPADIWLIQVSLPQLKAALLNLAINARDAMGGVGELWLAARNMPRTGQGGDDEILITMTDSGSGMSEEILSNVFMPFYTTKTADYGTGLGLSLVRHFAETSNATLEVESEMEIGSRFSLSFPRFL